MTDTIGPDIRDAWLQFQMLQAGDHPSQGAYDGLPRQERLKLFLDLTARAGAALPGLPAADTPGRRVNAGHVQRLIGMPYDKRGGLDRCHYELLENSGLPIAADTYIGEITGRVGGLAWRDEPITLRELRRLVRMVSAAAFVIVCYLSGMRPGEVLNLRHGCRDTDPHTGELLVRGRRGKGYDRTPPARRP